MSENVLVTGGAGYVGSHTCKALAAAGYVPVSFDNLSRGHRWAVQWGPLEVGDVCDRRFLDAVIDRWRPVAAVHFAALSLVGESVVDPGSYYRTNVGGALTLAEALRDGGVQHIVFSSTCAVYGLPDALPIRESEKQQPINTYGWSKVMAERILQDFGHAHGMTSMALRYFNAAGADLEGAIGEAHEPETHLIPIAILAALGCRPHLDIFGTDYPTPDGTCIRDYVHVDDLASAHVLALQALRSSAPTTAFNLGAGSGLSVREIVAAVTRASGTAPKLRLCARRPGDPPVLVADPMHAAKQLGWRAAHSDVDTIIRSAWRWHASHSPLHNRTC